MNTQKARWGGGGFRQARRLVLLVLAVAIGTQGVAQAALEQSSYRFLMNLDAADPRYVVSNLSSSDDTIADAVIDPNSGTFFSVGYSSTNWLIEKRSETDGSLITSFGTSGQIIEDVASSNSEQAYGIVIDSSAGYIYIVGNDRVPGVADAQWRIEKRSMSNGNLDTSFDGDGIIQSNVVAAKDDEALAPVLDTTNGYLYVAGYDGNSAEQWHIEKRRTSDGAVCSAANCGTEFGTAGVLTQNLSGGIDRARTIAIDPSNQYLYLAGQDSGTGNTAWRVEKRRASDGAVCSAANCGTQFGTNGVYTSNPTNGSDGVTQFQVDSAGNAIYVGGYDNSNGRQWRIEKLDATTGSTISAFGTSGVVTSNPGAGSDEVVDLDLDGAGGYVFIIGIDANGSNQRWRIEKRNRSDGALVSAFATSGVLNSDPSANNETPGKIMIDVDRSFFWAVGGDRTLSTTNMRWRFEQYQLDNGGVWLSAEDTAGAVSTNITFRLRMLLHTTALLSASSAQYKLQYAQKSGTCDTAFTGETYSDVTSSGEVQYHDNPSLSDATTVVAITGDPTHGAHTNVLQTIEEANDFTNPNSISSGQDGLWDFAMKDSNAFGAYCFRAVNSDGSLFTTYTVVPELSFCKDDPKTESVLRHGAYFCEGIEKAFFWSKD